MGNLDLIKLEKIESTNLYGLNNLESLSDRQVIVAEKQIKGRGRFNRVWVCDGTSNIYMSIILKPQNDNYPYANVTQYLSVVLASVLEDKYGIKANIKWPNDILVDGAKMAGILCEASTSKGKINGLVLGLGVNLNLKAETVENIDQKATSLNLLLGKEMDKEIFTNQILEAFWKDYDSLSQKGFGFIRQKYINRCDFLNKEIKIKNGNESKDYTALAINEDGSLKVKDSENNEQDITTGDLIC